MSTNAGGLEEQATTARGTALVDMQSAEGQTAVGTGHLLRTQSRAASGTLITIRQDVLAVLGKSGKRPAQEFGLDRLGAFDLIARDPDLDRRVVAAVARATLRNPTPCVPDRDAAYIRGAQRVEQGRRVDRLALAVQHHIVRYAGFVGMLGACFVRTIERATAMDAESHLVGKLCVT